MPLIPVLADMERNGLLLDLQAFNDFLQEVEQDLAGLTSKIYGLAGGEFNIRSAQQLGDILFERLALPKAGKTKGGALSTSQEALEKLAGKHEIVDTILNTVSWRRRSTYLAPFPKLVDAQGRIHASFNQMATGHGAAVVQPAQFTEYPGARRGRPPHARLLYGRGGQCPGFCFRRLFPN